MPTAAEMMALQKKQPLLLCKGFFISPVARFACGADEGVRPYTILAVGQGWFVRARFEGGVALVDLVPIDDVPPGREIFGTTVVVLQVVGVLPNVVAED